MPAILFYFVSVQLPKIKKLRMKLRDKYGKLPNSVWRDSNFARSSAESRINTSYIF